MSFFSSCYATPPKTNKETKQQTNIFLSEGSGNIVSRLSNEGNTSLQFIYCMMLLYCRDVLI